MSDTPDEFNYTTSAEANMAIVREINEIIFMEKMKRLMPLVAKELIRAGVDFSKVKL